MVSPLPPPTLVAALRQGDFHALFVDCLGWQSWTDLPAAFSVPTGWQTQAIARLDQRWVIELTASATPVPAAPPQAAPGTDLLLIWRRPDRGLLQWQTGVELPWAYRHALLATSPIDRELVARLWRLRQDVLGIHTLHQALADPPTPPGLLAEFAHSMHTLERALPPTVTVSQRPALAAMLGTRLIVAAALQDRGWLGGDRAYLVNQFGRSQQRGPDRFYAEVLRPLGQALALPPQERSPALRQQLGTIPFLPTGPTLHPLEQQASPLALPDTAFEPWLLWLDSLLASLAPWTCQLPRVLEGWLAGSDGLTTPEPLLHGLCYAPLHQYGLGALGDGASLPARWMDLSAADATALATHLGDLSWVDPACGSGRYVVATLGQLRSWLTALVGVAATQHVPLPSWLKIGPHSPSLGVQIQRHLLSGGIAAIDCCPKAVAFAQAQVFIGGIQGAASPDDLLYLPDPSLTVTAGDALVGLVTVDAQRFDQVGRRGETALQGNLMQPLMADSYQTILAERQVRLETYRHQTALMAETRTVPDYARADFLRDRLEDITRTATHKLDRLLWQEASQQWGMRLHQPEADGRFRRRPLTLEDVSALRPYHWGFHWYRRLTAGGFDVVVCHPPTGALQPTVAGFWDTYGEQLQAQGMDAETWTRQGEALLATNQELATLWQRYRGQWAFLPQYCRHCGYYPLATGTSKPLYWGRLFLERSLALLRPGGYGALLLDVSWNQGKSLRQAVLDHHTLLGQWDLSNHGQIWPHLPSTASGSLVQVQAGGHTATDPRRRHDRAATALTPTTLAAALEGWD